MKKRFILLGCIGSLALSFYFLQGPLMVWGAKRLISSAFPNNQKEGMTYEKASFEKGKLLLTGVQLKQGTHQLLLDQVEAKLQFDWKAWRFSPEFEISHPSLQLGADQEMQLASWIRALKPHFLFRLKVDVENGVLLLDGQRFYFSFHAGESSDLLGTLRLSLDPSLLNSYPFLTAQFEARGGEWLAQIKMQQVQADQVMRLLGMTGLEWAKQWQGLQGIVDLEGHAILTSSGKIRESSAQFSLEQVELQHTHQPLLFKARHLEGSLEVGSGGVSVWNEMIAAISLEKAELELKDQFILSDISGTLSFDPQQDPAIALAGRLGNLPFTLDGKGALHEDQTYWLECALEVAQEKKAASQLFLSLCSPESDQLIMQIEAKQCSGQPLALLQSFLGQHIRLVQGSLEGRGVAQFKKGQLSKVEIEQLKGCKWLISNEEGQKLRLEEILLTGEWTGGNGECKIHSNLSHKESLAIQVKSKRGKHEFSGLFEDASDTKVQFGFTTRTLIPRQLDELKEGWIRGAVVTPASYRKWLRRVDPTLDMAGDLDLFGTFDGKELELSIQCDEWTLRNSEFTLQAPQVGERDPMLLKTKGRAKLRFIPSKNLLTLDLPLKNAKYRDKQSGFLLSEVEAELHYQNQKGMQAQISNGRLSFADKPLVEQLSAEIEGSSNDQFVIRSAKGKWGDSSFQIAYMQFDNGLLSVKGEVEGGVTFSAQRAGESIRLKALLPIGELDSLVHYDSKESTLFLEKVLLNGPKGNLEAIGTLQFELPEAELPLFLRSQLMINAHVAGTQIETKTPLQIAFSPGLGFEASHLHVELGGFPLEIEQIEWLMEKNNCVARGCKWAGLEAGAVAMLSKDHYSILVQDENGELALEGRLSNPSIERAEGQLKGLACKLKKTLLGGLSGNVQIDTAVWKKYLPEQWREVPEGEFCLIGEFNLSPFHFNGEIQSEWGSAKASLQEDRLECKDIQLKEGSTRLSAPRATFYYDSKENGWQMEIPSVQLKDMSVSAVPGLLLKEVELKGLKGLWGVLGSLSATGSLQFQADPTLLKAQFPLGENLAAPLSGSVEYRLEQGRCLLTQLKNVVTQEKRTHFSLIEGGPSFFDLKGNLFLNLLFESTESRKTKKSIPIQLRGTLKQPLIGPPS